MGGMLSPFDFVGYSIGAGVGAAGGSAFGLSLRSLFYLFKEEELRSRMALQNALRIETVLRLESEQRYLRWFDAWRRDWASTYTTLLAEI